MVFKQDVMNPMYEQFDETKALEGEHDSAEFFFPIKGKLLSDLKRLYLSSLQLK